MMFSRATAAVLVALPILAAAQSDCTTGSLECCSSVSSSSDPVTSLLLSLLGIVLGSADVQVGVTCSPITVVGTGGTSCSEQPVCCSNNSFNGVVALGCTPVNINL